LLTWTNFDGAVQNPGKYKLVKFFTRNCRYCRLLKQVEEQLREEKQWAFEFYEVDCSIHYDLCVSKAAMSAFPYVAIYDTHGKLHGTIGGYYPLDTMREAFNTIEAWQTADLQTEPQTPQIQTPKEL
jgi:thioredoxin-related protein